MSNMAPDLSGLDPFINTFILAVIGALISLAIIGQTVSSVVAANRQARVAVRATSPAHGRRLVTSP